MSIENGGNYANMTLRDWFAGQALTTLANATIQPYAIARWCYEIADEMLKRSEEENNKELATYNKLIDILGQHCGETGVTEGAVDTLERKLKELAEAREGFVENENFIRTLFTEIARLGKELAEAYAAIREARRDISFCPFCLVEDGTPDKPNCIVLKAEQEEK